MKKLALHYLLLAALLVFTIALGINTANAGIYADKYGLDGARVGWFAPIQVPLMGAATLGSLIYIGVVLELTSRVRRRKSKP
jgi:hypothetical protein